MKIGTARVRVRARITASNEAVDPTRVSRAGPRSAKLRVALALALLGKPVMTDLGLAQPAPVPPAASAPERTATVLGQRIRYRDEGAGPTVVLVHGLNADARAWEPVIGLLVVRGFRVVALDQVGFGGSDKPATNYRPAMLVDFLDGFLGEIGVARAHVVGWSLGGAVAAGLALARPERVERLVLVSAGYAYALPPVSDPSQLGHNPGTLQVLNASTRAQMRRHLQLIYADDAKADAPGAVDKGLADTFNNAFANQRLLESFARREDALDGRLGGIRAPTLVVGGVDDGVAPHELDRRLAREIPGARLVSFDRCGHAAPVERSSDLVNELASFLAPASIAAPR